MIGEGKEVNVPLLVASSSNCVSTAAAGMCTYRTTEPRMNADLTAICAERRKDGEEQLVLAAIQQSVRIGDVTRLTMCGCFASSSTRILSILKFKNLS